MWCTYWNFQMRFSYFQEFNLNVCGSAFPYIQNCLKSTEFSFFFKNVLFAKNFLIPENWNDRNQLSGLSSFSDAFIREASPLQNGWIFWKVPKGGGVISGPKIYIAKFGLLNRAFQYENDTKGSFQGMVFNLLPFWTFVLHASHGK